MSFGVIRSAIKEAIPANTEPKITKPALTESELAKIFCVAIPRAAANEAAAAAATRAAEARAVAVAAQKAAEETAARIATEQKVQSDLNTRKTNLQDKLLAVEARYTAQYSALDALLFKLNSTSDSLKSALDGLTASQKNN